MKLIELHLLQSFPATCLNRDDVGAPKSIAFGGVQRARVSSQCWKRAIRKLAAEQLPDCFAGQRGHYHHLEVSKLLQKRGVEKDTADDKALEALVRIVDAKKFATAFKKAKQEGKFSTAMYLTPHELERLAAYIHKNLDGNLDKSKLGECLTKGCGHRDFADIAIFGRMVAADHSLMLEGAGMFAHAISTHGCANEVDFFSAVDDTKPEESEGAGHIGTLELNTACYYRYIAVNVDLLFDGAHLHDSDTETRQEILSTFLKACLMAVPTARKNSMQGDTLPDFVLGIVRDGQPLSLANAFETPVRAQNGYLAPSEKALKEHWDKLKKMYELNPSEFVLSESMPLNAWVGAVVAAAMGG